MAQVSRSVATLRIVGDDLIPDEVSLLLGRAPDSGHRRGEELIGKKTGIVRIAKFGRWGLSASDAEPENLDEQVSEILNQLTTDLSVWRQLAERFDIDLFCGIFMNRSNEGMSISPASLAMLGDRGIELALDIYSGEAHAEDA